MPWASHISQEWKTPSEGEHITHPGLDELDRDGGGGADADDDDATDDLSASMLEPGVYVARYRILDVVGSGGIGVVYAAFDEDLGRNVALKLLRPSPHSSRRHQRRRGRLVREAQALARLSHPNVVPIYEVGMFEERIYIAMEYVEGSTMRRWLRREPRTWEAILDKFIQAGQGLAAAHAADIVHRDFKPDNVLVGRDERVRVLDFGLATPVPDTFATGRHSTLTFDDAPTTRDRPKTGPAAAPHRLTESVAALITAHGKVMGTPAYMAPEQGRGDPIDARADQYSFCVALWEALFGERPQGPPTATARVRLHRRVSERGLSSKDAPLHIQRALERGLSLDPRDRYPDMPSLLAALAPGPATWRRKAWIGASVGLGLAAIVGVGLSALVTGLAPASESRCVRDEQALAGVWDPDLRAAIEARLTATQRPYAAATWTTFERELDRWSSAWLDARVESCAALESAGTADTDPATSTDLAVHEARLACLDRQLDSVAASTSILADGVGPSMSAETLLDAALTTALELPELATCDGAGEVGDLPSPRQRQRLTRARTLEQLGEFDAAASLLDEVSRSPAADLAQAETDLVRGRIFAATGAAGQAQTHLRAAVLAAQTNGQDAVGVEACAALVTLLVELRQLERAEDWAAIGRATLERLQRGGGAPELEADLRLARAQLAAARGHHHLALSEAGFAVDLRERVLGPDHTALARALAVRGRSHSAVGQRLEAVADLGRALRILEGAHGPQHPLVVEARAAVAEANGSQTSTRTSSPW